MEAVPSLFDIFHSNLSQDNQLPPSTSLSELELTPHFSPDSSEPDIITTELQHPWEPSVSPENPILTSAIHDGQHAIWGECLRR